MKIPAQKRAGDGLYTGTAAAVIQRKAFIVQQVVIGTFRPDKAFCLCHLG